MSILGINFYATDITEEAREELTVAIAHEGFLMNIQLLNEAMAKLDKKINNENDVYTEEEVEAFKVQLAKMEEELEELEISKNDSFNIHNKVVENMSMKNENGFGNSKDVVRTVLRVLASANNSKLVKYAIIPAFTSPQLYEALETIHINSKYEENGEMILNDEVKNAYKKASNELESIIKNTFSLPFGTAYTDKTRVKINAEDKKLLNDCYIKGFSNKFSENDEGVITFKKRQINTLVKVKKNKKTGEKIIDYSGLATTISNIVLKHYFA